MILRRYLTGIFLGWTAAVLLGLVVLLQLLDLLDKTSEVLQRGGPADIGRYALLRLPTMLGQLIPLAVLVGAILTFRRLAGTLEITALRALGLGAWRILGAVLPACVLAVALQAALLLAIAPRTERALADWWDSQGVEGQPVALAQRLWLRNGAEIVSVEAASLDGRSLAGILLVRRDAEGRALERIDARRAIHGPEGWRLLQLRLVRPGETRPQSLAELAWADGPSPEAIRDLARPIAAQPLDRLLAGQRGEGAVTRGPAFYATRLQAVTATMVAPFVMLLLAAPAAFGLPRQADGYRRGGIGLALGLGYLVVNGLLNAMGEAGGLGPHLAAWTAPLVFALVGLLRLWHEEA
ncbi:LptF/LptG family permease [Siccirubricoccus sp. KC 17139]|uniref:LptF/LptG family permease n=1 Tax=Siccirubricoccus soli TaxID=2899147 RepID=A0ABT1D262_9PROT|nr:LptF/LptG family permease [Siccirubricoccus soli]MCO6416017.1 LptF/LptG family permease [Siccirubricoccus soli]MCP2682149.1 LptF/LptG family permease [Siccirubricoccus soli]